MSTNRPNPSEDHPTSEAKPVPALLRYWKMVLEEPYRIFFPLGMLAGVHGVVMWPLYYGGKLAFNPIDAHPRMMIGGLMAAFVAGFMGTAFPRLTGNRHWTGAELLALLGLWAATAVNAAKGRVPEADGFFAALVGTLFLTMAGRWLLGRRDTPPPGFVLALAGLLGGAAAAGCLAWERGLWLGLEGLTWAKLWYFQGFLALPVMGVGPYLLPRFFGQPSSHSFDESPRPPAGWWPRVGSSVFWGLHLVVSFLIEVKGYPQIGQLLRAITIGVWFALETPVFKPALAPSTAGNVVRMAVFMLVAGWVAAAFVPQARIGNLHLVFVGGLGLLTSIAATRVILGHSGRHDLLTGKRLWMRWLAVLIVLAATTRMSADLIEKVKISHHIYAAWTWVAATALWFWILARHLFRDESSVKPRSACPRRNR
ncbi:MAG: NnrS family protein [Verrucomicrobia bacterium]|nr:NnrS family protein [Verrucomicrobiota bacterium]